MRNVSVLMVLAAVGIGYGCGRTEAPAPSATATAAAESPVLTLVLTSDSLPLSKIEDLVGAEVVPQIAKLPGVGQVTMAQGRETGVIVSIQGQPGANRADVLEQVKALMPHLQASLPGAVKIGVVTNR